MFTLWTYNMNWFWMLNVYFIANKELVNPCSSDYHVWIQVLHTEWSFISLYINIICSHWSCTCTIYVNINRDVKINIQALHSTHKFPSAACWHTQQPSDRWKRFRPAKLWTDPHQEIKEIWTARFAPFHSHLSWNWCDIYVHYKAVHKYWRDTQI